MNNPARVSLAIPVYNEEAVAPELIRRTTAVLDALPGGPHEIVLVDDGSSDRGAVAVFLSVLFSLYSLYVKFWLHSPQGFTAIILALTFFSGVNLFFLGIIGEYVGRVYEETKGRPHYVLREVFGRSGQRSQGNDAKPVPGTCAAIGID